MDVDVRLDVKLNAPAPRTTMYVNHTYTVYGTLMPKHTSGTYIRVNAYKWDSKQAGLRLQEVVPGDGDELQLCRRTR